jgi:hypothetical protein
MRCFALVWVLAVAALAPPAAAAIDLSDQEQDRLEQGEVVVVDRLPPGGPPRGGQGGTGVALTQASAGAVWRILVDYPRHSGLYPRVVAATVLESDGSRALVRYVVAVGPFSFGFHVNNYADEGRRRLVWELAHGRPNDLFEESWGYWQVDPSPRGTVVTYSMAGRTVLPGFLTRGAEREGLVATLKAVRSRAELAPAPGLPQWAPRGGVPPLARPVSLHRDLMTGASARLALAVTMVAPPGRSWSRRLDRWSLPE